MFAQSKVTMRARWSAPAGVPHNYPRRYRPGTEALRDIRRYQNANERVIPNTPFQHLVREIMEEIAKDLRIQLSAIDVLQEAYIKELFKDSQHFAIYGKRTAGSYDDMNLVQRIRGQRF